MTHVDCIIKSIEIFAGAGLNHRGTASCYFLRLHRECMNRIMSSSAFFQYVNFDLDMSADLIASHFVEDNCRSSLKKYFYQYHDIVENHLPT